MKSIQINTLAQSKAGIKTKVFSNTTAITWNLKRRFK